MELEASGLSVRRETRRVLSEVDLHLNSGECVAVVGPNGSGKTTLVQALLGIVSLEQGRVQLGEHPLSGLDRRQIARAISYLPQSGEGTAGFPVREVLRASRYAYLGPFESLRAEDQDAIDRAVSTCEIGDLLDRRLDQLSGGERQRVWLAAVFAQASPMVFLDEPTAALDPGHRLELIRLLREQRRAGQTMLIVTHDLELVQATAGRVMGLRSGSVVWHGSAGEFLHEDPLREVFNCEFELLRGVDGHPSARLRL